GQFSVSYFADGYITKTETVNFISTFTTSRDIKLQKNPLVSEAENELNTIKIFPNPAQSQLNIKNMPANTKYYIYSVDGKLLRSGEESTINIEFLRPGMYNLYLETPNGTQTTNFIKQ
ncbi:MAG TPA: T9SS type A sorting domain-containing protein, partial [Bacteroidia bacterium]